MEESDCHLGKGAAAGHFSWDFAAASHTIAQLALAIGACSQGPW